MMTLAALVTIALAQDPLAPRPVVPSSAAPADTGRIMDVEGPWIAALRLLPLPDELSRFHAPRRGWELARLTVDGFDRVVLASSAAQRGGQGAPSFVAVAPDGGMTATWWGGFRVATISPAGTRTEHSCLLARGTKCLHLEHDGLIYGTELGGDGEGRALSWRSIDVQGLGEPRDLGTIRGPIWQELHVVREKKRLAWIQGKDALAVFDVETSELTSVPCPGIEHFDLDGVHGGVLFAHSNRADRSAHGARSLLRTVKLDTGRVLEQPSVDPVAAFTPEGWMTETHWVDPTAGTRVPLGERATANGRHYQVGASELWANGHQEVRRYLLRPEARSLVPAHNQRQARAIAQVLDGESDERTLDRCLASLAKPYSTACLECLVRVARDAASLEHRSRAIGLIAHSDAPGLPEILRPLLLNEPNWWERVAAIKALARIGDTDSARAIVEAVPIADEVAGDRAESIALALAILGDVSVLPEIEALLERTGSERVRCARDWLRQREAFLAQFGSK